MPPPEANIDDDDEEVQFGPTKPDDMSSKSAAASSSMPPESPSSSSSAAAVTSASDKYAAIATLDEELDRETEDERWMDRTSIITKFDHEAHIRYARDFVLELADNVVDSSSSSPAPLEMTLKHER